jgi:CheY-like chemotaxis protein
MNKKGPVIVIEDDVDDQEMLTETFEKIGITNKIKIFDNAGEAYDYLDKTVERPFLILSDINMPKMNGFQLRDKLHADKRLALKTVPFLFFSSGSSKEDVIKAYTSCVQGYFKKPTNVKELEETLRNIMQYWKDSISPGRF